MSDGAGYIALDGVGASGFDEGVAGIDEVGRGPLAGPVVAAAVILLRPVAGIADSKQLSAARRRELARLILESGAVGLAAASVAEIDRINILQATFLAMRRAVARLRVAPRRLLVDGNKAPAFGIETICIVGGDASEPSIGAASIVAKVARDRLMARLGSRYPAYGWDRNAGYGTAEHLLAMRATGLSPHHRRSFAPARQLALGRMD
jgi:ribonuclease HII